MMKTLCLSKLVSVLLLAGLMLSACSAAPDATDVEQAIERNIRATLERQQAIAKQIGGEQAGQFLERMGMPSVHDIDISDVAIQSSKKLEGDDYQLQVTYQANVKDISRRSSMQVILGQRDGQWTVLN